MKKNLRSVSSPQKSKQPSGIPPADQLVAGSQAHGAQQEGRPLPQHEAIFASLPDAALVCDRDGKLLCMNNAALKLFEVSSAHLWLGTSLRECFQRYEWCDEQQFPTFLAPERLKPDSDAEAASHASEQTLLLGLPSGHKILLELRSSSLLDARQQASSKILLFHKVAPRYQKALHLQRVSEAISILNEAVAQIPEHFIFAFSHEMLLLSSSVLFVAQHLVDVIRQVLACWRVSLIALGSQPHRFSYAVGSGFTMKQEQLRREVSGRFLFTGITDETVLALLQANQEVMLRADRVHFPTAVSADFGAANLLLVPLFLEQHLIGALTIAKQGWDSSYSQEEIALVKAVAAQALLIVEYLGHLQQQADRQTRKCVLHEVDRLSRDFLTLASHELRTPLTGIKGNLQLAQRRLKTLKCHVTEQSERAHLEHAQQSLAQAEQSTRLQERMVQDLIDDARIQANQLELSLTPADLLALITIVVVKQQASVPERTIILEDLTTEPTIPVLADLARITQVLAIYLANALTYSPAERPVTVQVRRADYLARVSVHDEGAGISSEEQGRLWRRFYRGKGNAVQHELDLSLGLGFYLCQALIERHDGHVGVESEPGHGATFWFTLPIARSAEMEHY